ncbi:carbonic anhydrase, partial [Staphylococcus aureus]
DSVYVIRNAGGHVTQDAIRSLVISYKLLGAEQIFVIQHTDCGMQKFTDAVMNDLLTESLVTATLVKDCNVTLYPVQSNNTCQWVNTSSCCGANVCNSCG